MGYDRTALPEADLDAFLAQHRDWSVAGAALVRTFELASFADAIAFVTRVAFAAEKDDHHPDIDIRYRKVTLRLSTHETTGLTFRDTKLAATCDTLFSSSR